MKYKDEDIKYFINRELMYTPKHTIRSCLMGVLLFGLPTAVFAMHSYISKIIMLLTIIILCIWSILLLRSPKVNQNQFNLYGGVLIQFFSILLLIVGIKELSHTIQISQIEMCLLITLYLLCIAVNLLIIIKLIKKGHYRNSKNQKNFKGIVSIITIIGVLFGSGISRIDVNQDAASYFMGIFFIVAGFYFSLGTTNFLRYYLGKKSTV